MAISGKSCGIPTGFPDKRLPAPMIWLLTGLTWLVTLALTGALTFGAVLLVAGPHAGLLPPGMEAVVIAAGWLFVLVVPVWISHRAWRHLTASRQKGQPSRP